MKPPVLYSFKDVPEPEDLPDALPPAALGLSTRLPWLRSTRGLRAAGPGPIRSARSPARLPVPGLVGPSRGPGAHEERDVRWAMGVGALERWEMERLSDLPILDPSLGVPKKDSLVRVLQPLPAMRKKGISLPRKAVGRDWEWVVFDNGAAHQTSKKHRPSGGPQAIGRGGFMCPQESESYWGSSFKVIQV